MHESKIHHGTGDDSMGAAPALSGALHIVFLLYSGVAPIEGVPVSKYSPRGTTGTLSYHLGVLPHASEGPIFV